MGLFSWLFGKKEKTQTDPKQEKQLLEARTKIQELEQALVNAKNSTGDDAQLKEQKAKYEALLAEANAQIKKLDEQLACALEGKVDSSIESQLAQVDSLKKKIKDLEDDLKGVQEDARL